MEANTEPIYSFNANLLTLYTEVLMGNLQRLEDTKPDYNSELTGGRAISNQTLLLGFIFKYLKQCNDVDEAMRYYKEHKAEMDSRYKVERIVSRLPIAAARESDLKPIRRLKVALYMFYEKNYDKDMLAELLSPSKKVEN